MPLNCKYAFYNSTPQIQTYNCPILDGKHLTKQKKQLRVGGWEEKFYMFWLFTNDQNRKNKKALLNTLVS